MALETLHAFVAACTRGVGAHRRRSVTLPATGGSARPKRVRERGRREGRVARTGTAQFSESQKMPIGAEARAGLGAFGSAESCSS